MIVTEATTGKEQRRFDPPTPRDGETLAALENGDVLMLSPDVVSSLGQGASGNGWEARPVVGVPESAWLLDDVVQFSGSEGWAGMDSANGTSCGPAPAVGWVPRATS